MIKARILATAIGISALLFATLPVQAASLTSTQISAIVSLLQTFGADQSAIASVNAALGGSSLPSSSCVNLFRNLTLGSTGSDVTNLQNYLITEGDLASGNNTSYYGYLTVSAVGQLQVKLGLVSGQSDSAYGFLGPQTRSTIRCGTNPPPSNVNFSATPTSGSAPLAVDFIYTLPNNKATEYSIVFGDGQTGVNLPSGWTTTGGPPPAVYPPNDTTHTYTSLGTYTAKLEDSYGNSLGTVTITVTGSGTTQP